MPTTSLLGEYHQAVRCDAVSCLIEMHEVSARTGVRRMRENTNVAALTDLRKRKPVGRMTIGIDLGDRKSHFCVLNDQAQVIARGFLPTTITAFRREFEALPPSLIAIKAGAHSLWANQVLKVCGHEVLVGNPRKIRLITESDRKSDRVDAESLARLARADRLLRYANHSRLATGKQHISLSECGKRKAERRRGPTDHCEGSMR
jgi:hypothetical protein